MKRILIAFLLVLNIGIAYSADKTITSKTYVENQLATKQDTIPAVDTNTVITHTGTAGDIGEKGIYDSTGNYAEQQASLVTAGDANTGINNALENEFVCIDEDTDGTCLLWKINNTVNPSKNLFDIGKIPERCNSGTTLVNNGDGSLTVTPSSGNSAITACRTLVQVASDLVVGKTYTISFDTTGDGFIYLYYKNGTTGLSTSGYTWRRNTPVTLTDAMLNGTLYFYAHGTNTTATISHIQIEEGGLATPYQPYGNTYIPSGN